MSCEGESEVGSVLRVGLVDLAALPTCLAIRHQVFVLGQGVPPEREVDGLDEVCSHFLATLAGEPIGTARLLPIGADKAKAQRVAVLPSVRGRGVGAALMEALDDEAIRQGRSDVRLDSQVDAIAFYERLGYAAEGPVFLDAGIPHRRMRKRI